MNRFWLQLGRSGQTAGARPERHHGLSVFFRGYLANRDELIRQAAGNSGSRPDELSDGELLARGYRRWGEELPARLLGEFALVILDDNTETVLAAHDALGLRPLFYAETGDGLLLGTHLADVAMRLNNGLDEEYLADYLCGGVAAESRTPFQKIRRLEMGHSLLRRRGKAHLRRTWGLATSIAAVSLPEGGYEERFLELAQEGVRAAMGAKGHVTCELSGGLDSSTVACLAAQCDPHRVEALSHVYEPDSPADEIRWMREVIEKHRLPWTRIDAEAALPFAELPLGRWDEPNLSMVEWPLQRRCHEVLSAKGQSVVLTGQGGDLVCFGPGTEPFYLADMWRNDRPWRALTELKRWQRADRSQRSLLYWLLTYGVTPLWRRLNRRPVQARVHAVSSWIDREFAKRFSLADRGQRGASPAASVADGWLSDSLSRVCGQVAALNQAPLSLEFRHPLLHRPLVEFMVAAPWREKLDPRTDRHLQRKALAGVLPEAIRTRRSKTILDKPFFEGLRRAKEWTELLLDQPRIVRRGMVDESKWKQAVAQARLGMTHDLPQFVAAATLEIWLRQWEDLPAAPTETTTLDSRDHAVISSDQRGLSHVALDVCS